MGSHCRAEPREEQGMVENGTRVCPVAAGAGQGTSARLWDTSTSTYFPGAKDRESSRMSPPGTGTKAGVPWGCH